MCRSGGVRELRRHVCDLGVLRFRRRVSYKQVMKIVSLTCNHCGSPLEVPQKVRFLTYQYCSSKLAVRSESGAVYTEVLEAIDERTERIADDVETIKLQNDLARLDREWVERKQKLMVRGNDNVYKVPSVIGSVVGICVALGFGIYWINSAQRIGTPGHVWIIPILFVVGAVAVGICGVVAATRYRMHRDNYERDRVSIVRRLNERESE